jgi:hypothetical protein
MDLTGSDDEVDAVEDLPAGDFGPQTFDVQLCHQ